jgi:hypothetical protein
VIEAHRFLRESLFLAIVVLQIPPLAKKSRRGNATGRAR